MGRTKTTYRPGDFVDARAVGEILGVSAWTVSAWARVGRVPHLRIGRVTRFILAEIVEKMRTEAVEYAEAARKKAAVSPSRPAREEADDGVLDLLG